MNSSFTSIFCKLYLYYSMSSLREQYNFTSLVLLSVMHGGYVAHDTDT
jgi:hypothetical protein